MKKSYKWHMLWVVILILCFFIEITEAVVFKNAWRFAWALLDIILVKWSLDRYNDCTGCWMCKGGKNIIVK